MGLWLLRSEGPSPDGSERQSRTPDRERDSEPHVVFKVQPHRESRTHDAQGEHHERPYRGPVIHPLKKRWDLNWAVSERSRVAKRHKYSANNEAKRNHYERQHAFSVAETTDVQSAVNPVAPDSPRLGPFELEVRKQSLTYCSRTHGTRTATEHST